MYEGQVCHEHVGTHVADVKRSIDSIFDILITIVVFHSVNNIYLER